mgnify:CR=1 FL=1
MKRFITLIIALSLIAGMAACGDPAAPDSETTKSGSDESTTEAPAATSSRRDSI